MIETEEYLSGLEQRAKGLQNWHLVVKTDIGRVEIKIRRWGSRLLHDYYVEGVRARRVELLRRLYKGRK